MCSGQPGVCTSTVSAEGDEALAAPRRPPPGAGREALVGLCSHRPRKEVTVWWLRIA